MGSFLKEIFSFDRSQLAGMLSAIPLLPFLGACVNGLFGKKLGHERAAMIANASVFGSFIVAVMVFISMLQGVETLATTPWQWFAAGAFRVDVGFFADHLSATFLMIITGIGSLIHWYSSEYMAHDASSPRYFAYLNLFVASMLVLVLGDNMLTMFVGWEGVGLCSYLLIGFWFDDERKATAGKKAFVVNRIGDAGFLAGIFILFGLFGTTHIPTIERSVAVIANSVDSPVKMGVFAQKEMREFAPAQEPVNEQSPTTYRWVITLALLCLFVGATGKSAQIPLYIWLPDAMAGPTPVSALIHAATMVTAGVYMIARLHFLFALSPTVLAVIAVIGALTALLAALIAMVQYDIKKVLAYSTVSQLGFMFIGMGSGEFHTGVFHVLTHAFFKACLFLGAGAVIHGLHEEQDIRNMGGLKKTMPQIRTTFLIATIAIAGILPLSGFFSKDAILHAAFASTALASVFSWLGPLVYALGTLTALLTSFYMFRLYFVVFEGEYRGQEKAHEGGTAMMMPLWILSLFSIAAAALGIPGNEALKTFLSSVFGSHGEEHVVVWPFAVALVVAWAGFVWARAQYGTGTKVLEPATGFSKAAENKFYIDEFYTTTFVRPLYRIGKECSNFVDGIVLERGLVRGPAHVIGFISRSLSAYQNGDTSRYAAVTAVAIAGLLLWAVFSK